MSQLAFKVNAAVENDVKDIETGEYHKRALSKKQAMQRCPVCHVYNDYITNVHCVKEHGMTKKEVEKIYGKIMNERDRLRQEAEMNKVG